MSVSWFLLEQLLYYSLHVAMNAGWLGATSRRSSDHEIHNIVRRHGRARQYIADTEERSEGPTTSQIAATTQACRSVSTLVQKRGQNQLWTRGDGAGVEWGEYLTPAPTDAPNAFATSLDPIVNPKKKATCTPTNTTHDSLVDNKKKDTE